MARYHPLSSLAVAGLVLGLLSALAVLGPLLWIIPAAGAVTSGVALWRIGRPTVLMAGRRLAQCGLLLSIMFGTMVQADALVYRFLVRREARQFAATWFGYLLARPPQPQKAYQLTLPPRARQPLDEQLGGFYRRNPHQRQSLDDYLQTPLVRKLLALGPAPTPAARPADSRSPAMRARRSNSSMPSPTPGATARPRCWSIWG